MDTRIYHQTCGDHLLNVFRLLPEQDEFNLEIGEQIQWPEGHVEGDLPTLLKRVD